MGTLGGPWENAAALAEAVFRDEAASVESLLAEDWDLILLSSVLNPLGVVLSLILRSSSSPPPLLLLVPGGV